MANQPILNLYIVRHGNTFDKGDVIRRVGLQSDLPLSDSGINQAKNLANWFVKNVPSFDQICCSELKRTKETAEIILNHYQANLRHPLQRLPLLNEIDYGIDDGKPESDVIKRLGVDALNRWEQNMELPNGWLFNPQERLEEIKQWLTTLKYSTTSKTIILITSNGIARLFTQLISEQNERNNFDSYKMPTASISYMRQSPQTGWECLYWGKRSL